MELNEIITQLKHKFGDGVKEGFVDEIKGKASEMLGGLGHKFGK